MFLVRAIALRMWKFNRGAIAFLMWKINQVVGRSHHHYLVVFV
ncbi:hypothetical protein QUB19_13495 [Microcoleus sp. B4-C5]